MRPNPTVSEFTINPEQPPNPQLSQSRNRFHRAQRIYHPHNYLPLHPQEIIIDVGLNNAPESSEERRKEQQNSAGIRWHIDSCLNAIEEAYHEKKLRENGASLQVKSFGNDKTIHRIDTNLVLEYIRTICKDYKLRDRFSKEELERGRPSQISQQKQSYYIASPGSIRQRGQSLGPGAKPRKQYLNLTQASKLDRSSSQKRKIQQPTSPRTHRHTYSAYMTREVLAQDGMFGYGSNYNGMGNAKFEEDFRYCINCQGSILSKNVDFHQKQQCRNFSALYKLNFSELTTLVGEKILRMNKELKQKIVWLKQKDLSKSRGEQICNKTLQKIEQYANENSLDTSFDKTSAGYLKITESLNNEYVQVVKMTHKLHWFNQVYSNLKKECSKRRGSSRVIDVHASVSAVSPIVQESKVIPQSPISQLYPHLHRKAMNPPRVSNFGN